MAVFIQGYLQREYELDISRSDIIGYLAKVLYDFEQAAKRIEEHSAEKGDVITVIGSTLLIILVSKLPHKLPLEVIAEKAMEDVAHTTK